MVETYIPSMKLNQITIKMCILLISLSCENFVDFVFRNFQNWVFLKWFTQSVTVWTMPSTIIVLCAVVCVHYTLTSVQLNSPDLSAVTFFFAGHGSYSNWQGFPINTLHSYMYMPHITTLWWNWWLPP